MGCKQSKSNASSDGANSNMNDSRPNLNINSSARANDRSRNLTIIGSDANPPSNYGLTEEQKLILLNATYKNTLDFSIRDKRTWAKVVKAYDGDSCHIAFFIDDKKFRISCRVYGIDTPEIRTDNLREKEYAYKARDRFSELTTNPAYNDGLIWVHIHNNSDDKYGRYLTAFYTDDTEEFSIDKILISENLGYEYYGKTKREFDEWHPQE
jgi:endonuclease YncB( thermonuclease family)